MTYAGCLVWTVVVAGIVAVLSVPACVVLQRLERQLAGAARSRLWWLLLIPSCTPPLLTGFAYSTLSLSIIRQPLLSGALYIGLLWLKQLGLGVLWLSLAPPSSVTATSLHTARLLGGRAGQRVLWALQFRRLRDEFAPLMMLQFLLAFQEFELASLLTTDTWTVWLFDAQALGMSLRESFQRAVVPVGLQGVLLGLLGKMLWDRRGLPGTAPSPVPKVRMWETTCGWGLAVGATLVITVVPILQLSWCGLPGLPAVLRDRYFWRELGMAVALGMGAGWGSWLIVNWWQRWLRVRLGASQGGGRSWGWLLLALPAIPGLFGSLLVALLVLAVFQWPLLQRAYDSLLPVTVGLLLFLWPRVLLLEWIWSRMHHSAAVHTAVLLPAKLPGQSGDALRRLRWRLLGEPQLRLRMLICLWAYFELTIPAVLAPPGLNPAPLRLYNQAHFGRGTLVSGMLLLTLLVPWLAWSVISLAGSRVWWGSAQVVPPGHD